MAWTHLPARHAIDWPTPRHLRHWTEDEVGYVARHLLTAKLETIARRLGRTPRAVQALQSRLAGRLAVTRQTHLTARQWALEHGWSPQYAATLCRRARVPARRVPGGRTWLIAPGIAWPRRRRACRADYSTRLIVVGHSPSSSLTATTVGGSHRTISLRSSARASSRGPVQ